MPVLESRIRSLSAAERRLLGAKARALRERAARTSRAALTAGLVIIAVLYGLTLIVSDTDWAVITVFWGVAGLGIVAWVSRDLRKEGRQIRALSEGLQHALDYNQARTYDVVAKAYVEFQEFEDEGAAYAFDLDDRRLVFVVGQEFYRESSFPSLDFSLVYPLGPDGHPVDMFIDKRGASAAPARVIPASTKSELEIPEHLSVLHGTLEEIELLLQEERGS